MKNSVENPVKPGSVGGKAVGGGGGGGGVATAASEQNKRETAAKKKKSKHNNENEFLVARGGTNQQRTGLKGLKKKTGSVVPSSSPFSRGSTDPFKPAETTEPDRETRSLALKTRSDPMFNLT